MASALAQTLSLPPPGGPPLSTPSAKRQRLQDGGQALVPFEENLSDDEESKKGGNKPTTEAKRFQHCEVEKRRRERMNRYMTELATMIPACNAVPRRLDKLSILKMAVDHMKNLRGDPHAASDYKPGFLTDDELKQLLVEAANGFMVIISCSQGRIVFVSDTIQDVLNEAPDNWMGTCFYDLLHPKDIQKVKEQLASFDLEEALKASVRQNVSNSPLIMHTQSMNGLRRSFLCRVKRTATQPDKQPGGGPAGGQDYNRSEDVIKLLQSAQQSTPYDYAVLHCTGFIRNLTSVERQSLRFEESSTGACLVAVARLQHFGEGAPRATMEASENEFVARVGADGRFTYVDPRIAGVLGYLPQDLIGQVSYKYYHPEDIQKMVQLHHDAMKRRTPMPTVQYRFLSKNQKWVWLAMKAFCFINPFSQQVEYVVCTNVLLRSQTSDDQRETTTPLSQAAGGLPQALDKQQSIERYVRMTISNQVEQQIMIQQHGQPLNPEDDPLSALLPGMAEGTQAGMMQTQPMQGVSGYSNLQPRRTSSVTASTSHSTHTHPSTSTTAPHTTAFVQPPSGSVLSTPASTTFEENAATVERILDEYHKANAQPPHRKDHNYNFPQGLFTSEIDLEGSQQAYQNVLHGLDNPEEFLQMFNQIEADPLRPQNIFGDIDFDPFD